MLGLVAASWETIYRRSALMVSGSCSPAEYQRMVSEKLAANHQAAVALMTGQGAKAVMAPYVKAARANAKRLRSGK